jgi:flagellar biosynthesis protein FlhG
MILKGNIPGITPEPLNGHISQHHPFRSRVVAVASGKGGVGKTNLAVNMGLALAKRGLRVALLDADLGTANVDVVLGLQPRYHLHHLITGQKELADIMMTGPFNLQVIPGASGLPDLADLPEVQRHTLLRALLSLDGQVDLLLVDTSAGVGRSVVQFILAAGELLLVTTPEPTAITDAYALIKVLAAYQSPVSTKLVVNNVRDFGEGELTGRKLMTVAERFLGRQVQLIGALPYDRAVVDAVRSQLPVLQSYPHSRISAAIETVSERFWTGAVVEKQVTGIGGFFQKILSLKNGVGI